MGIRPATNEWHVACLLIAWGVWASNSFGRGYAMAHFLSLLRGCDDYSSRQGRTSPRWYLLQTKHRQERILAKELSAAGMNCFSPTTRGRAVYGSIEVFIEQPLCPDQAYLLATESTLAIALANHRVISHRRVELTELLQTAELVDSAEGSDALVTKLESSADFRLPVTSHPAL
jgi:hypothetical protein